MDKDFLQVNKQISEFRETLARLEKDYEHLQTIKTNTTMSKTYLNDLKEIINKTLILENTERITKTMTTFATDTTEIKNKVLEINEFLEKFRITRTYKLDEQKKIFRFIAGFLDGFSEYFSFKPEFLGVIDLNKLADETKGKKEGTLIKINYENLPKLIEVAYNQGLKNFVLEAHNLKLTFYPNYTIKIVAENDMIVKIDKIAREINIDYETQS